MDGVGEMGRPKAPGVHQHTRHKLMALEDPLVRLSLVHRWLQQHQVL